MRLDKRGPADGDSFAIMSFSSRSGTFPTLNAPALGGGLAWRLVHGATSVVLNVGPATAADLELTMTDPPDPLPVGGDLR